jgi:hypothetical protein
MAVDAGHDLHMSQVTDVAGAGSSDGLLRPWQFFLLAGMLGATATVIVASGQSAASIVILSLTIVAAGFVGLGLYRALLPLVQADRDDTPTLIGGRTRLALEREKSLVLRSIKELEFDYAMGKVSKADFDEMSGRLRSRAIGLMEQLKSGGGYRAIVERELQARLAKTLGGPRLPSTSLGTGQPRPRTASDLAEREGESDGKAEAKASALLTPATCASCGVENDADARFCKGCGTKLS